MAAVQLSTQANKFACSSYPSKNPPEADFYLCNYTTKSEPILNGTDAVLAAQQEPNRSGGMGIFTP
jgi:hypothetical protein